MQDEETFRECHFFVTSVRQHAAPMMTHIEKDHDHMGTRGNVRAWGLLRASLAFGALAGVTTGARPAAAQDQPAVAPADPSAAPAPATPAEAAPAPAPMAPLPAPMAPLPAPMASPAPAADNDPIAGFSNGTAFLRSPDNGFVLFPNGRLQTDGYFFKTDNNGPPKNTFLLKRARLELAGWVGSAVYFQIGADFATGTPSTATIPVAQSNLNATDDFVALAPCEDRIILQFGQFDAPFTLENRTSDKYFDFMERSLTVRAFGIPTNKEQGLMLHGTNPDRNYYYSAAVLNGDGQNFKNVDNNFDVMARGWIAPLSFMGAGPLHDITVGGSYWTGNRTFGEPLASQTTAGGYTILSTSLPKIGTDSAQINQQGRHHTWALEINAPIDHKFGVRWELVHKDQPLSAYDTTVTPNAIAAAMHLKGWSTYGEAWAWVIGDDRIIGEPGMQMPTRLKKFGVKPPQRGLMVAARIELLDEKLTADDAAGALSGLKVGGLGETKLTSFTLGANYWISKRFRTTFNYVLNHFGGDTSNVVGLVVGLKDEQEFSFRLAIAL
jgi:hypothetical protein